MRLANNRILDTAFQELRARVIEHASRAFVAGRGVLDVTFDLQQIDDRTAHAIASFSDGTTLHVPFDILEAAIATGALASMNCFGSAERPN